MKTHAEGERTVSDWIEASLFAETGTTRIGLASEMSPMLWAANGWAHYEDIPEGLSGPKIDERNREYVWGLNEDVIEHLKAWVSKQDHEPSAAEIRAEWDRWEKQNAAAIFAKKIADRSASRILDWYIEARNDEAKSSCWQETQDFSVDAPKTDPDFDLLKAWLVEAVEAKKAEVGAPYAPTEKEPQDHYGYGEQVEEPQYHFWYGEQAEL